MSRRLRLPPPAARRSRILDSRPLPIPQASDAIRTATWPRSLSECSKGQSQLRGPRPRRRRHLSIALQHGVPAEAIRSAVTRDSQGEPSGIVGAVLDLLVDAGRATR